MDLKAYVPFPQVTATPSVRGGAGPWGWATWKRAWQLFDVKMPLWKNFEENDIYLKNVLREYDRNYLIPIFRKSYEGQYTGWDYKFVFHHITNNGLAIVPSVHLVRNIGFYGGAHANSVNICHLFMNNSISFPLKHPQIFTPFNPIFKPPVQLDLANLDKLSKEYLEEFRELLTYGQYHAVLMLFKRILQKRDTFVGERLEQITWYHLRYAYFVAIAYYNLNDDEHAQAMADIASRLDFQKVDCLILKAHSYFRQKNFESVKILVSVIKELPMNAPQRIYFENFCQSIIQNS